MVIYSLFTYFFALFTNHSRKARLKLMGSPIVLMENGNLYKENFKRAHLDIDEFLSACRTNGYFDVSKLHTAVMEPNGKISILPKAAQQPLTPKDMRQFPSDESLSANIIVDGILQEQNLQKCGKDRAWLDNCLRANGVKNIENVFLATLDSNNVLHIFQKLDFDTSLNNIS